MVRHSRSKNSTIMYTMRNLYFLFLGLLIGCVAYGQQHNYIFNGGQGAGFDQMMFSLKMNNSIFNGSKEDGFNTASLHKKSNNSIFAGTIDDGFAISEYHTKLNNEIHNGGIDDGWASSFFIERNSNAIFSGGVDDGWTNALAMGESNNKVFAGGIDDGFASSGISKMTWTGQVSDEWSMAGNWFPAIVPTINDVAYIPKVNTHYPVLKSGTLGMSINYTYACKNLYIDPLAKLTTLGGVHVINRGRIEIAGSLFFHILNGNNFLNDYGSELLILDGGNLQLIY